MYGQIYHKRSVLIVFNQLLNWRSEFDFKQFWEDFALERSRVGYFCGPSTYTREAGFHYHVSRQSGREAAERIITGHQLPDENALSISRTFCPAKHHIPLLTLIMYVCHVFPIAGWLAAGATFANFPFAFSCHGSVSVDREREGVLVCRRTSHPSVRPTLKHLTCQSISNDLE